MTDLEKFISLPDVNDITEEVFVSQRLGTFKIKAMTQDDFKDYQRQCKKRVGKNIDFDINKFNLLMVIGQTVEPDFSNKELLSRCNCALPEDLITKKLLAGEIAELARQIQVISGFDSDFEQDVEEAKN